MNTKIILRYCVRMRCAMVWLFTLCLMPSSLQALTVSTDSATTACDSVTESNEVTWTNDGTVYTFEKLGANELKIINATGYGDTLTIPETVTLDNDSTYTVTQIISGGAGGPFSNKQMKVLVLPASLYEYGDNTFAHCYALTTVINKRPTAPSTWNTLFNSHSDYVWRDPNSYGIYNSTKLIVPFGSKPSYARTTPWRYFSEIVEGLEEVGLSAPELIVDSNAYNTANDVFEQAISVSISNPNTAGSIYYYLTNENGHAKTGVIQYDEPVQLNESCGLVAYITDGTLRSEIVSESYSIQATALFVKGIQVSEKNQYDILEDGGSVYLDPKTGELVLDNSNINATDADCGIMAYGDNLTIRLKGHSTITASSQGIEYNYGYGRLNSTKGNNLRIVGDSEDGTDTLTINMDGKPIYGFMVYLSNLTLENCNIIVNASDAGHGIYYKAGDGKTDGILTLTEANLRITSGYSAITGVYTLNLSDSISILEPVGGTFSSSMMSKGEGENILDASGGTSSYVCIGKECATTPSFELEPVEQDAEIAFTEDKFVDDGEPINLNNIIIDNIYFNIDNSGEGSEVAGYYDTTESCIVINQTTSSEQMEVVEGTEPGTAGVTDNYTGLIFEIPAGQGVINVEAQALGENNVAIQVGCGAPTEAHPAEREEVGVTYDTDSVTVVYIYATSPINTTNSVRKAPATATNAVRIFSIMIEPQGISGITSLDAETSHRDVWHSVDGRKLGKKPTQKGVFIHGKDKIIMR